MLHACICLHAHVNSIRDKKYRGNFDLLPFSTMCLRDSRERLEDGNAVNLLRPASRWHSLVHACSPDSDAILLPWTDRWPSMLQAGIPGHRQHTLTDAVFNCISKSQIDTVWQFATGKDEVKLPARKSHLCLGDI